MVLSQIVKELRQLSGLTAEDFCQRLNISVDTLLSWEQDDSKSGPSVVKLFKALSVTLTSRRDMDHIDRMDRRLSQAKAIVVTVSDSEELSEDQRLALSAATDLVDDVKRDMLAR